MIAKVKRFMEEQHMLSPQDSVVAGVSGGADSVCLLFLLCRLQKEIPFRLCAVHVNHQIRKEAAADELFVKNLCREWSCEYRSVQVKAEEYASSHGISCEEAGRLLRYRAFEDVLGEWEKEAQSVGKTECVSVQEAAFSGKIAVAHHKNDSAETVLFHLFRGTGLAGLTGIHPVRGRVIRPLLCVERWEIELFLKENGLSCCIDATNQEDTYTRNRIRHHILPYAETEICSGAVSHIYDASVIIREAQEYIRENAQKALRECMQTGEKAGGKTGKRMSMPGNQEENGWQSLVTEISLQVDAFLLQPAFIQKQVLLLCMERLVAGRKNLGAAHIMDVQALFLREGNRRIDLPGELIAEREYGLVRLKSGLPGSGRLAVAEEKATAFYQEISVPGKWVLPGMGTAEFRLFSYEKYQNIPEKPYTKWFDYDKIVKSVVIRGRRTGDYLTINSRLNKKSLKEYLIQEKIPKEERERIFVLADGQHIIWVIGRRISEYYKVNEKTKTILEVEITGGIQNG